jgi:hypothetical protein
VDVIAWHFECGSELVVIHGLASQHDTSWTPEDEIAASGRTTAALSSPFECNTRASIMLYARRVLTTVNAQSAVFKLSRDTSA